MQLTEIVDHLVPWILGIIMAFGAWLFKLLNDLDRWRASHEAQTVEREKLNEVVMRDAATALQVVAQHGDELNGLREQITELTGKLEGYFNSLDQRFSRMERRCVAHLDAVTIQNGASNSRKPGESKT